MKFILHKCLHSYFYPLFSSISAQFQLNVFSFHFSYAYPTASSTTLVQPTEKNNTKMEVFFMREIKNTKIIAVDHGYGNIKTANTVTPTGIKAY